jgi:4-aminobutyrate aminotransferase/(S)-3-amino-2-methylpropionate transaminase
MKTSLPGPKAMKLMEVYKENVPKGVFISVPTFIERGEGAVIEDVDGNIMLDFAGGIGVLNIGYSNPEVIEAVKEQSEKFFHTSINIVLYEKYLRLAQKLNELTPGDYKKKTMLTNSGAEANENAIKIAKRYTGRNNVISFTGAFHGRTMYTMGLTSKVRPYKYGFGAISAGIYRWEFPYCYRCPFDKNRDECELYCAKRFEDYFLENVAAEDVAAIIIEPLLGEGGFVEPPKEYIIELRKICNKYGIVLIADEVQTGYCRTGRMYASDYWGDYGVFPDIVTTAKSIAGGLPISTVTAREEIFESPQAGGIGGTFCGNPVAAAAGLKVLEIMERDNFPEKAMRIGEQCKTSLEIMKGKYSLIGDIRIKGAMVAIELVKDRLTKEPAKEETGAILKGCYQDGLILMSAGIRGNVIRFLMPLVVTEKQLEAGLSILEKNIQNVE